MLDNIQLDQEEDVDPPVELFNWGAGGMVQMYLFVLFFNMN
jgi:hypothetical protein